jgi:plasmid stability protein
MGIEVGQLLVRGVDDGLVRALRDRAARAGRSVEAEHRAILEQVLGPEQDGFVALAARLRATTPPGQTDAAALLREDRDRDCPMAP